MKSKLVTLTALGIISPIVLTGCYNDTHKQAKGFCLDNGGTYSITTTQDEEYGECIFPSGIGCRDEIILTDECEFIADTSFIDTEEKRLSGCNENANGWIEEFEEGEDIEINREDEDEAGASFVRNGTAKYIKEGDEWKIDIECIADFVDGSLGTSYGEAELIKENKGSNEEIVDFWKGESKIYSEDELQAAVNEIMRTVNNEWNVEVKMQEIIYQGDEGSNTQLNYCKELNENIEECVMFKTNFYIPEQDVEMAGGFEPDTTIKDFEWYLGKSEKGDWKVLTAGVL